MIHFSKIRWKNFLSTGDTFTEIELDQSPSTLVIGENGSGKSTMLDALTYGLYSKPFRKVNKPQLVNSVNEKGMLVEVEFSSGSKSYLVRRGVKPNIFEIYVDGEMMDQDSTTKLYQDRLEKYMVEEYGKAQRIDENGEPVPGKFEYTKLPMLIITIATATI